MLYLKAPILAMLFVMLPVSAVERQVIRGHVPPAARFQVGEPLPATNQMRLTIGLPLRRREELASLLQRLYNPASGDYRHFLTPEEFSRRFAPGERDYQAVISFARSNGLEVVGTHPNRMMVDVRAPVAAVERAFGVKMRMHPHPTEPRSFYAPDVEPSMNLKVPILHLSGLDNYVQPHPMSLHAMGPTSLAAAIPLSGSGTGGSFIGSDFRKAYVPGSDLDGAGQVVGLFELNGYYASDIAAYKTQAGLPDVPLQNVLIDGFNGSAGGRRPGGLNEEVALDIEVAISMAPGLSQVVVYEGTPNATAAVIDDILNRMATDNVAKQLSCSWGFDIDVLSEQVFQQFAAQGQSFFLASGDSGAFSGAVMQPSDNPYITVVGGTVLTTSSSKAWASETAWSGSGGGISTVFPIPSWQWNIDMSANQGSATMRNTPDVAMVAYNVLTIADRGASITVQGTSIAAPLWAGFMALVNQQAAAEGKPPLGFLNPTLYAIGRSSDQKSAFHDIVSGNNTSTSSPNSFYAVSGYDLCTGWGTPNGTNLIDALVNPAPAAILVNPPVGFTASGPAGGPFGVTSGIYTLTTAGTVPVPWALLNLPPWLDASPQAGTIIPGAAPATLTVSLNAGASNLLVGSYSATLVVTNLAGTEAQELGFDLFLGNAGFETGDFAGWTLQGAADSNFVDSLDASQFQSSSTIQGVDDSSFVHAGIYGAFLGESGSLAYLSQTLPTQPGGQYILSFWLANPAPGTPNEFQATWDGTQLMDQIDADQFGWTYFRYVVTASGSSTVLQFGSQNDQNAFALDDISVQPVSAPQIQAVSQPNGSITLSWLALPGLTYAVETAVDLTETTWSPLTNGISAGIQGIASVSDDSSTGPLRFYRVVVQP